MPFQPVDDGGLITIHGTGPSGVVYENTIGFVLTVALTQAITDDFSTLISGAWDGNISDYQSDQVEFTGITATDLRTETGPQFDSAVGWPLTGASSSHPLPLQTAALVSWTTGLRGASYRGRMYIGGYAEAYSNGAHLESAAHTSLADFADAMIDAPVFGVISRYWSGPDGDAPGTLRDPAIITPITGRVVHDLWATQRRRAPR